MLEQYETARLEPPKKDILRKAIDAIRGLFAFAAEQIVAMSISKASIDLGNLWLRQRRTIGATKGLTFERGGDTFDDIGGLSHLKEFGGIFTGSRPPQAVCRLDELEKMTTGATGQVGDISGISHDALGMDLRIIQDRQWSGLILVGPPGTSNSLYSKALGNTLACPPSALISGSCARPMSAAVKQRSGQPCVLSRSRSRYRSWTFPGQRSRSAWWSCRSLTGR